MTPIPPALIEEFPIRGQTYEASSLALGSEGGIWFVEGSLGRLGRITPSGVITGEFSVPVGTQPGMPDTQSLPSDLALGLNGNMWFVDHATNSKGEYLIGRISPAGMVTEFPIPPMMYAGMPGHFFPGNIALGSDGNMWFTDEGTFEGESGFIGRIAPAGTITEFPIPTGTQANVPESSNPVGIALGPDGNMWFTDQGTNSEGQRLIGRITPAGTVTEFPIPTGYNPTAGIALGADNDLWFTESPDGLGRITATGSISEYGLGIVSQLMGGITPGSDGNLWFRENANILGRISPQGSVTLFSNASREGNDSGALIQGAEGDLWYFGRESIVRLITPSAPSSVALPLISGRAVEGQALSASVGSWTRSPSTFEYQWQVCGSDGANCENINGGVAATHGVVATDLGHTLRAVVTAGNFAGSASAASAPSAIVVASVSPPTTPVLLSAKESLPVVRATMTWSFGWSRTYTIVEALAVHDPPAGGLVEVDCRGKGCPFSRRRLVTAVSDRSCSGRKCPRRRRARSPGSTNLADLFRGRRLRVGARISVRVTKTDWVGKSFEFTVRANRPPRVRIVCLASGANNPAGEC
ncbi:MAG TPA: hypothetical protein VNY31_04115 [Solirubrobacteraceae bacterium]|jgi:streptogramin lyase|nr:hypothetical protein [Solirubrobacteraceae bacterium]